MPLSIGWGAVALFVRHLPRDSETMRAIDPSALWSDEARMLARLTDLVGDLFAQDYEHIPQPGATRRFSTAAAVDADDYAEILRRFGGGADG